ncbi:hypothetical protein [Stutzerimonas nitrititolerans]|uniref:hypothetical protein n=1 Tax=Stutzerimonas nitrititolerans TaxID=2482751 RepID=UPI0028A95320|nr:hypothetical protein [Stutzerimonas nitrititolerans]
MNLEVGKTYKTRNGSRVTLEHDKGDPYYPFFGKVFAEDGSFDRIAYFAHGGKYNRMGPSDYDIVRDA